MTFVLTRDKAERLEGIIQRDLIEAGAQHVIIVDLSGNLIVEKGTLQVTDLLSLAVLLAANFAATAEIARLVGETDFSLLFHKGDKTNIHFSKLGDNNIIITFFDDNVSLGLIRLRSTSAIEQLATVLNGKEGNERWHL